MIQAEGRQQHYNLIGYPPTPTEMNHRQGVRVIYTNMPGVNVKGVISHLTITSQDRGFRKPKVIVNLSLSEVGNMQSDNISVDCNVPSAVYLMEMHGLRPPCDMLALELALEQKDYKKSYEILRTRTQSIAS